MSETDESGLWLSGDGESLYWIFPDGVAVPMDAMSDDDWREALAQQPEGDGDVSS